MNAICTYLDGKFGAVIDQHGNAVGLGHFCNGCANGAGGVDVDLAGISLQAQLETGDIAR